MKLLHLSDLHLGKKLNEFSLLEDQQYILAQLVALVRQEHPDAVLIAGDVYDKSFPAVEAVKLFDNFLTQLADLRTFVCIISGNHDSAERLAFGARLMQGSGVHLATGYNGEPQRVVLQDEYGSVNIFLLPFIKPVDVKRTLTVDEAEQITSYHAAVKAALERLSLDKSARNVLVAHQFVTGAQTCGSEMVNVGGLDNIGAEVFAGFDYVALGHIHSPQNVGSERLRYCGTPLAYSFSECGQQKSATLAELDAKGSLKLKILPLTPLRVLRKLKGKYAEVMRRDFYAQFLRDEDGRLRDFFHITLTDEDDVVDAVQKLRVVYKNLLQLQYDNRRTAQDNALEAAEAVERRSSLELIGDFYALQNNQELNEEQKNFAVGLLARLEEADA